MSDIHSAEFRPALKLRGVEVVDVRVAAAKEEERGREVSARGNHGGALLDEAPEGREAGAGGDADDGGVLGVAGEVEGRCGGAHGDVELLAGGQAGEEICRDAEVAALAGEGGGVEEGVGEGEFCWVGERR